MRQVLASVLSRADKPVVFEQARCELLKYVPGKRGVIAYHLASPCAEWDGGKIFGKIYRKERGLAVFNALQTLWRSAQQWQSGFAMPEPLAYAENLGMVLQRAARGRALAEFSHPDDLFVALQRTAKNLAALHGLPIRLGEEKTFQDHLRKYCHPGPDVLAEAHPALAPLVRELVDTMITDASLRRAELCPVHGDLNLTQIFITEEQAIFIDFDGFCRAHAALDVGNFLVTLAERFGERSGELRHGFLEAYLSATPTHMLHGLRVYQAFAYLRRAMIAFRLQDEAQRLARAQRLLEAGLTLMNAKEGEPHGQA